VEDSTTKTNTLTTLSNTVSNSITDSANVLSGSETQIVMTAAISAPSAEITFSVNGSSFWATSPAGTDTYSATTTGNFTSPSVTWHVHALGEVGTITLKTRQATLKARTRATVSLGCNQPRTKKLA